MFERVKNLFSRQHTPAADSAKLAATDVAGATGATEAESSRSVQSPAPELARRFALGERWTQMRLAVPAPTRQTLVLSAITLAVVGAGYGLWTHPPVQTINPSEVGVRINELTGQQIEVTEGKTWAWPGLHRLRVWSLRDQSHHAIEMSKADGQSPVQSLEGLSLGVDLMVRYALDPKQVGAVSRRVNENLGQELVQPALQGVVYKTFSRYTVREIFSTKRAEIQQTLEAELKPMLAAEGLILRSVQMGKVDLPADYSQRMETLLAEELASQKMRYTLEIKEKRVKETELEASAEKVRRQLEAEAAGNEQIIAAKAQEEAMKHVLPYKQRQVEQRKLEAEAQKQAAIKTAEGNAEARRIEADGEAKARQRLAEAEAYRMQQVGIASAEQMSREGTLLSQHPLLIQKAMADKLSDKVQVIIAPTGSQGGFIGSALLGEKKSSSEAKASND